MGCGSSVPEQDLQGAGSPSLPTRQPPGAPSSTVVIASKPTKAVFRPKKDELLSSASTTKRSSASTDSQSDPPHTSKHGVVPVTSPSSPAAASSPSDEKSLRPSSNQQRLSADPVPIPRTPELAPAAVPPSPRSKSSSISSPAGLSSPSLRALPPLKTLPPVKIKGAKGGKVGVAPPLDRPSSASTRDKEQSEARHRSSSSEGQLEGMRPGKLARLPSRSSVMLPALPPPSKPRLSILSPIQRPPPAPTTIPPEYQSQLDATPSLWSSPTLLRYYPDLVFTHYAELGASHTSDYSHLHKKGVTRLSKDAVDEWLRVWKVQREAAREAAREGGEEGVKEGKKKEGVGALSKVLAMGKKPKEVTREEVNEWVMRRVRQEMRADGEGRVAKAVFINEWKATHSRVFGIVEEKEVVDEDNPMACSIM